MKVARTHKDAKYPTKKYSTDAGYDFYALHDYVINPQTFAIVKTGVAIDLENPNLWMLLKPKGGSRWLIGGGVVDYGYTGGIMFRVINPYNTDIVIRRGDAVGQGIIMTAVTSIEPTIPVPLHVIQDKNYDRGDSGGIQNSV